MNFAEVHNIYFRFGKSQLSSLSVHFTDTETPIETWYYIPTKKMGIYLLRFWVFSPVIYRPVKRLIQINVAEDLLIFHEQCHANENQVKTFTFYFDFKFMPPRFGFNFHLVTCTFCCPRHTNDHANLFE